MAKHFAADELAIEVDTPKGERYNFQPSPNDYGPERFLRSRHATDKLTQAPRSHLGALAVLPEIPGQHVVLNIAKGYGKVIDPLGWPENEDLLAKLAAKLAATPVRALAAKGARPIRDRKQDLSALGAATWLYHMRRAVCRYTIRPVDEDEEAREVANARVIQDPGSLLTCSAETVAEKVAEWMNARVEFLKSGNRQVPITVAEMKHYNRGDWATFREQRAIDRLLAEGKKA